MKVGDQVVCVKTHNAGVVQKDIIYTILNVCEFSCGCILVDVGVYSDIGVIYKHGTLIDGPEWWLYLDRFAPIQRKSDEFLSSDKIEKSAEERIDIKLPVSA